MLRRNLLHASPWQTRSPGLICAARSQPSHVRAISATPRHRLRIRGSGKTPKDSDGENGLVSFYMSGGTDSPLLPSDSEREKIALRIAKARDDREELKRRAKAKREKAEREKAERDKQPKKKNRPKAEREKADSATRPKKTNRQKAEDPEEARKRERAEKEREVRKAKTLKEAPKSLKEALLAADGLEDSSKKRKKREEQLQIQILEPADLTFEPIDVEIPPVPKLSYGLDRVLFNPGVYRLQDPRSRIFNFDPYLEKIMPVNEFDFDALSEYKTSSKDEALLDLTKKLGTKFTGSTSSMSGVLQHFHFLLSNFRGLNHQMLSRGFPDPSSKFSKITFGPDAIFLRYKKGIYAIDADKTYDSPNIMSWLGHSLEKLLTTNRDEFELFRRSSPEKAPAEDNSSRCYHYSKQGNLLMRSQLDAQDPRLPGTGVFDLKTRAVVSIRMNHKEYESGSGYQLRYAQGEWESYEREFYDMTRATLLKYSLQVRMGRMDGIFLAYHNIERIFGFQYLPLGEMDRVLHGQEDTILGDQEFKLSIALLDEMLGKAIAKFPETSLRIHMETRNAKTPFMYIFVEPVTDEQADEIQSAGEAAQKEFAQTVVGIGKDDPEVQAAWQNIQDTVDEQVDEDEVGKLPNKTPEEEISEQEAEEVAEQEDATNTAGEQSGEETETSDLAAKETSGEEPEPEPSGPLMGWTLTIRNKVNDGYVAQPVKFRAGDEWKVEYHVQEIPEGSRWRLYTAVKERRRGLIGQTEEADKGLKNYRDLIQRFSNKGRAWRATQDKLNEEMGIQVYKPLGPGSDAATNHGSEKAS